MDIVTLAIAKKYTNDSLDGKGAIKGEKGDKGDKGDTGATGAVPTFSINAEGHLIATYA